MGYAKPTAARLIDQRARRRATQALIEAHRDDYQRLYDLHRAEAEREAESLTAAPEAAEHYRDEPVRLMPGRRLPEQQAGDRIDVARCPHCVKHHDRNHVCPKCGAAPVRTGALAEVRRLAAAGTVPEMIAMHLRMPLADVRALLEEVAL